jgi:hypothetical protein
MVSMSVLCMLILMYASLFNSASRAWLMGGGNAERRRNARALTDYIGSELQGAMLPVQTVSGTGSGNLQFVINPKDIDAKYRNADCMFWQAALATESTYGDIAEIGYFVKWDDSTPGETHPMLCRFFVNPSINDEKTISKNPNFLIFDKNPASWLTSSMIETVAPATRDKGYLGLFGENVIGFWVRSYGLDGQELPREFDSRIGYDCHFSRTDASGNPQSWTEKRYLPAKVQISIAELDSHYAQRLGTASSSELRPLITSTSNHDATEFLAAFRQKAASSPALASVMPGLRIHSTEVRLRNAR